MKPTWAVLVVYEDLASRERAMACCDELVQRFWADCCFHITWWAASKLVDSGEAEGAAAQAMATDLLIVALSADPNVSPALATWFDLWAERRGEREGALLGVIPASDSEISIEKQVCLRMLAHRAGMDFLTQVPRFWGRFLPDSPESCTRRANAMSHVLSEILSHRNHATTLGSKR